MQPKVQLEQVLQQVEVEAVQEDLVYQLIMVEVVDQVVEQEHQILQDQDQ